METFNFPHSLNLKHVSTKGELLIFNCLKFSKNHKKTF